VVWGATPEQEKLKAKKLSDKAHAAETVQSNYRFASENLGHSEKRWRGAALAPSLGPPRITRRDPLAGDLVSTGSMEGASR
jgi:hypothetical protein